MTSPLFDYRKLPEIPRLEPVTRKVVLPTSSDESPRTNPCTPIDRPRCVHYDECRAAGESYFADTTEVDERADLKAEHEENRELYGHD